MPQVDRVEHQGPAPHQGIVRAMPKNSWASLKRLAPHRTRSRSVISSPCCGRCIDESRRYSCRDGRTEQTTGPWRAGPYNGRATMVTDHPIPTAADLVDERVPQAVRRSDFGTTHSQAQISLAIGLRHAVRPVDPCITVMGRRRNDDTGAAGRSAAVPASGGCGRASRIALPGERPRGCPAATATCRGFRSCRKCPRQAAGSSCAANVAWIVRSQADRWQ